MFPRLHLPRHAFHVLGFFILTGSLFGAAKEATLFTSQVEPGAQASTLLHAATEALKADIKDPKQPLPQETLDAFIDVARLQVVLGDFDAAKATLAALPSTSANALVASSIDEGHSARDWILFFIAKDRLKNGDAIGAAREAARMAPDLHPDREPRMDGYVPNAHAIIREALKSLVAARRFDEAIEAARGLAPKTLQVSGTPTKEQKTQGGIRVAFLDTERDETLRPLFSGLTRHGQASRARQVALTLLKNTPAGQDMAMLAIALTQAEIGQSTDAKKWAASFFEPKSYTALLGRIAAVQAKTGDDAGAARTFAEAERSADTFAPPVRRLIREDLVVSHAEAGHETRALELFEAPDEYKLEYLPPEPGSLILKWMRDPASIKATASETNQRLQKKGTAVSLESQKDRFDESLARAHDQLQHLDEAGALQTLTEAWMLAFDWLELQARNEALSAILKAIPNKPVRAEFVAFLDQAFEQCKTAEKAEVHAAPSTVYETASAWGAIERNISLWHVQQGDFERALAQVERMSSSSDRDPVYTVIIPALAAQGETEKALRLFALMDRDKLPLLQLNCARQLIKVLVQHGAVDAAKKVSASSHSDKQLVASIHKDISEAVLDNYLEKGDLDGAQVFLAAQKDDGLDTLIRWHLNLAAAFVHQHRDDEARIVVGQVEALNTQVDRRTKTTMWNEQRLCALNILLNGLEYTRSREKEVSQNYDFHDPIGMACGALAERGDMATVQTLYQAPSATPMTKACVLRDVARVLIERNAPERAE